MKKILGAIIALTVIISLLSGGIFTPRALAVDKEITAVTAIGDITVAHGTLLAGAGLPVTAVVTLDINKEIVLA